MTTICELTQQNKHFYLPLRILLLTKIGLARSTFLFFQKFPRKITYLQRITGNIEEEEMMDPTKRVTYFGRGRYTGILAFRRQHSILEYAFP